MSCQVRVDVKGGAWLAILSLMAKGGANRTRRVTLTLDADELMRAKQTLGTKTDGETVNRALHEVKGV
jgi:hypothetical protein